MTLIDVAVERNRAFSESGAYVGQTPLAKLRLFVVTCLDPRTDPAYLLGLGLSDAFVPVAQLGRLERCPNRRAHAVTGSART
jgi:carbonic anhydrase